MSKARYEDRSVPYPGRVWYRGRWRTPAQVEQKRAHDREWEREKREADPEAYRARKAREARERYANDPEYAERIRERMRRRRRATA